MPAPVLRSTLVPLVRQHADMVNSQFVTDAEIQSKLDEGAKRLYDMLIDARGQEYYSISTTLSTVIGLELVELPSDFYQLLAVTYQIGGIFYPMRPYLRGDTAFLLNVPNNGGIVTYRYRLTGALPGGFFSTGAAFLDILPLPGQVFNIRVDYIPIWVGFVSGGDVTYDGINGWEQWIVYHAACYCLAKQDSPGSSLAFFQQEMLKIEGEIRKLAEDRDGGEPPVVRDTTGGIDGLSPMWPWGGIPR